MDVYYWLTNNTSNLQDPEIGRVPGWDFSPNEDYPHFELPRELIPYIIFLWNKVFVKSKYDVLIINGYSGKYVILAIITGLIARSNLVIRSDTTLLYKRSYLNRVKRFIYIKLLSYFVKAFMVTGTLSREHLEIYGIDPGRIYLFPYSVDNSEISNSCSEYMKEREELRSSLSVNADTCLFLAVIKFVEREGVLDLLEAFNLVKFNKNIHLILVGDGELSEQVTRYIMDNSMYNVTLTGYLPYSELPKYYAISDVFIHPAVNEPWGVSVNEAMACGLPVIVSDLVGSAYDLVKHDLNGYVFKAGDYKGLSAYIIEYAELDKSKQEYMKKKSLEIIEQWDYSKFKDEIIKLTENTKF